MRTVVALGGNALLRRGEQLTAEAMRANVRVAAAALASIVAQDQIVVTHGNGPQIGLLAAQSHDALDVLGAETEGMIGYMIEAELRNALPPERVVATLLTLVEVDADDPAFDDPTKFVGPVLTEAQARQLSADHGWNFKRDGLAWRRVVASPRPRRIVEIKPIHWLLEQRAIVIAAGGGGIPAIRDRSGALEGVEAVIDKDFCSELLARELAADRLLLITDVDAVYADWGTPEARRIVRAHPDALRGYALPAGSMGPKVEAACGFVERTGNPAVIGGLASLAATLHGGAGTMISLDSDGIEWAARHSLPQQTIAEQSGSAADLDQGGLVSGVASSRANDGAEGGIR
jgi:carbamate kinase